MISSIFTSLFTSLFTTIFIILGLIILLSILKAYIKKNKNKEKNRTTQKKAKTILIRDNNMSYESRNSLVKSKKSFFEFKRKLLDILENKKIENIILDLDNFDLSTVQVEEIEPIFEKMRKEKNVISIASDYDKKSYRIAMLADKIYLQKPVESTLTFLGYSVKQPYLKKMMDKIGIKFNVIHIGDFKSAGENLYRDEMSEESRRELNKIHDEILDDFVEKVKQRRGIDIKESLLNGDLIDVFNDADNKLIDDRINFYNLIDVNERILECSKYKINKKKKAKDIIAVVTLDGTISEDDISLDSVEAKIDKLFEYGEKVKGVVLEINSPGGSAFETALIHSYIKENVDVPIYVSMKDYAASGGYYLSTLGEKIFANKTTISGSIGVVLMMPKVNELFEKIGVNVDGISKGNNLDLVDKFSDLSEDTIVKIKESMVKVYEEFKSNVVNARQMSQEKVESLAQGKIYLSREAKENGLIDEIGSLEDCISSLASKLNLEKYSIVHIENNDMDIKKDLKERMNAKIYSDLYYRPCLFEDSIDKYFRQ